MNSWSGDLVKVQDKKTGSTATVKITDDTKVLRDKHKVGFRRHEDMDVTATVDLRRDAPRRTPNEPA